MGLTAGIFLASILLKEMRYLVYIRYLWYEPYTMRANGSGVLGSIFLGGGALGYQPYAPL